MSEPETNGMSVSDAGAKGGKARAMALTPEQREKIARRAVEARWHGDVPRATHGSPDRPLVIGDIAIPCYVVQNGNQVMRVIVQAGMIEALGMTKGGSSHRGGTRLTSSQQKGKQRIC